ncbi:MAG TPA: OmpA family protein [Candidatus Competibacteraceae bacterium]|nr:OmpA family protein [Candidatus Competibacteraceae bacterium]
MKSNFTKIGASVVASLTLLAAAVPAVQAQEQLFVRDNYDRPVKDPFDRCVLTMGGVTFPECVGEVAAAPAPQPVVERLTLSADAFFDFDKSTLKPAGKASLDKLVSDLNRVESVNSIDVVGHTDSVGSDAYNQRLSERRAAAVQQYLVQKGVNPAIIHTSGMGERQPVASNATAEGRAKNRRVEITIEASGKVTQ